MKQRIKAILARVPACIVSIPDLRTMVPGFFQAEEACSGGGRRRNSLSSHGQPHEENDRVGGEDRKTARQRRQSGGLRGWKSALKESQQIEDEQRRVQRDTKTEIESHLHQDASIALQVRSAPCGVAPCIIDDDTESDSSDDGEEKVGSNALGLWAAWQSVHSAPPGSHKLKPATRNARDCAQGKHAAGSNELPPATRNAIRRASEDATSKVKSHRTVRRQSLQPQRIVRRKARTSESGPPIEVPSTEELKPAARRCASPVRQASTNAIAQLMSRSVGHCGQPAAGA